jgi:hypothetical protein
MTRNRTPSELLKYLPWQGWLSACYIIRNKNEMYYAGYYPDAQVPTRTRVWGRSIDRTEDDSLEMVLEWFWRKQYERLNEERPKDKLAPEPPSLEEIAARSLPNLKKRNRVAEGEGGRGRGGRGKGATFFLELSFLLFCMRVCRSIHARTSCSTLALHVASLEIVSCRSSPKLQNRP